MTSDRSYDIVLLGATGFAGRLTAEYLAEHAPADLRWALAGRDSAKLAAVAGDIGKPDLPCLTVDVSNEASVVEMAESTRVVVTTVGPYQLYGEPVVAACASAGTDYLDLTGEPEFVDRMYVKYHEIAKASGARLIHCAGFDSIPHDLGAYFTVQQLPEGVPLQVRGVVRAGAQFSGGTMHSALNAFSRPMAMKRAFTERRRLEGNPVGRSIHSSAGKPGKDADLGYWLLPLPTLDPQIVARSAAALDRYGPDFRYQHFAGLKTLAFTVGGVAAVGGLAAAAQIGPVREFLKRRVPAGTGPSEAVRAKSWFTVDFVGEGGGKKVHTRVSGGDPGYDETAKMLAESALCLASDELPETSGQVTTAAAMGDALIDRLVAAGIKFEVIS